MKRRRRPEHNHSFRLVVDELSDLLTLVVSPRKR